MEPADRLSDAGAPGGSLSDVAADTTLAAPAIVCDAPDAVTAMVCAAFAAAGTERRTHACPSPSITPQSAYEVPTSEVAGLSHAVTSPVTLPVAFHVTCAPPPLATGLPCEFRTFAVITADSPGATVTVYGSGESTMPETLAIVTGTSCA
jgi:hypothetical protein